MRRECNGQDSVVGDGNGYPCSCGLVFDDLIRSPEYPHYFWGPYVVVSNKVKQTITVPLPGDEAQGSLFISPWQRTLDRLNDMAYNSASPVAAIVTKYLAANTPETSVAYRFRHELINDLELLMARELEEAIAHYNRKSGWE